MHPEEIRSRIKEIPFHPFPIHMADGRRIRVHHRDFIMIAPNGMTAMAFGEDGRSNILDTFHITGIEPVLETTASPTPAPTT